MSRGKRTSSCAVLLLLCTVLVLSGATNETKRNSSTCGLQCEVSHGKTEVKCTMTADPLKLICSREVYSNILRNVTSLDLSDNRLTQVPTWMFSFCKSLTILSLAQNNIKTIENGTFRNLTNLTSLSLAQNNIKTIEYGKFRDLRSLTSLNLSFNDLREWRIDGNIELQSLNYLDVTSNEQWTPSEQILQLKNLAAVQGVTWSEYCKNCSLVKRNSDAAEVNSMSERCYDWLRSPSGWKWHEQIKYGKALDFIKLGFWPTCLCHRACLDHQYYLPYVQAINDVIIKGLFPLYATGSVALLVNITVVLVILCHKSLRGNLAVRLILNIAFCDVLVGLVSLLWGRYSIVHWIEFLRHRLEGKSYDVIRNSIISRNIIGLMLTCAVVSQVFGSFILTLEKFLKIVFAMKPDIRIGKRGVMLYLFLSWSFSLIFALLPVFHVRRMTYLVGEIPLPADFKRLGDDVEVTDMKPTVGFAACSQIVLIIIQLTSFVLYLPVFIVSKRSGASVGIKREATLARKIALLVFTNLIFFTIPVVMVIMVGVFQIQLQYKFVEMQIKWQDHALTEYQWIMFVINVIPMLCVSVNSVLNPFLYALRHPKIKQQLKTILCRCRNVLSECSAALRLHLPCCHSNAGQPGNNMELN